MKITKSQLKQIIKEELQAVMEIEVPARRQEGRYEEERCVSCVQDINKHIKSSGYEVIMLETYPVQYQLKPLASQVKKPDTSNVPPYEYEPPFDGI
jgi:hypothetical protein